MAQPSVAQYFNNRKRSATDDYKLNNVRKVLILDGDVSRTLPKTVHLGAPVETCDRNKETTTVPTKIANVENQRKPVRTVKKPHREHTIHTFLNNMKERCTTPPNATANDGTDPDLNNIKQKLLKSSKLKELKDSIRKFNKSAELLKVAEKKVTEVSHSPKLKTFTSIEFEVTSPRKIQSPEKPYLSPKKESSVKKNLLNILSPSKHSLYGPTETGSSDESPVKQGLKLPYKYRSLAELFRAIDTVSQILHNRKELITFRKLKPAVEEMLKRNLTETHLAQIKFIYPSAYEYRQEKIKQFPKREEWNLVLSPSINNAKSMTPDMLLNRRRRLYDLLLQLVKDYHQEFLLSLTPPMVIDKDKITRWHPEFDLEKVPCIQAAADMPRPPVEEKLTSGKEVLERARLMFHCNTRMEQALARVRAADQDRPKGEGAQEEAKPIQSLLKGVPKALLEKVRQKQAAKALLSMTRSADAEKAVQMYGRLADVARFTRNVFVSEKRGVLPLDVVVEKLGNSYRCSLNKVELEDHLKAIAAEVPDWLVFHQVRNSVYVKLAKNADLSKVLSRLEKVAKEKRESN